MTGYISPYKFFFGAALFVGIAIYAALSVLPLELTIAGRYLLAISSTSFVLTGFDKKVAGTGAMRVPEKVLFIIAALGGSVGVLLGTNMFRHKTRKGSFQLVVLIILVAQVVLLRLLQKV